MRGKTAKLLRKFSALGGEDYQANKKMFKSLPVPARELVAASMREKIKQSKK